MHLETTLLIHHQRLHPRGVARMAVIHALVVALIRSTTSTFLSVPCLRRV